MGEKLGQSVGRAAVVDRSSCMVSFFGVVVALPVAGITIALLNRDRCTSSSYIMYGIVMPCTVVSRKF